MCVMVIAHTFAYAGLWWRMMDCVQGINLCPLKSRYPQKSFTHFSPTDLSFTWCCRQHRTGTIKCGHQPRRSGAGPQGHSIGRTLTNVSACVECERGLASDSALKNPHRGNVSGVAMGAIRTLLQDLSSCKTCAALAHCSAGITSMSLLNGLLQAETRV